MAALSLLLSELANSPQLLIRCRALITQGRGDPERGPLGHPFGSTEGKVNNLTPSRRMVPKNLLIINTFDAIGKKKKFRMYNICMCVYILKGRERMYFSTEKNVIVQLLLRKKTIVFLVLNYFLFKFLEGYK